MYLENAGINKNMGQDEIKLQKKPKSISLPKISPVTRLILFTGIFLIIGIPLYLVYSQQQIKKLELNQQLGILQKAMGSTGSPDVLRKDAESEIVEARRDLETARSIFPNSDQSPEIIDGLIKLAKANGAEITKTQVVTSEASVKVGSDTMLFPAMTLDINLRGQVPKFQNFLLALINSLPTSQIKKVYFNVSEKEGQEDTGNVVLTIFSSDIRQSTISQISITGKKPLATFTDKKDKVTDIFKTKSSQMRFDWKVTATDSKWASFYFAVYRKGETGRYVAMISRPSGKSEGTEYIYTGDGDFYIKVAIGNVSDWEIKVYE
jgi:hypothetical protein